MASNLSPNQFALPGMENLAHPLAQHLNEGLHFQFGSMGARHLPAGGSFPIRNGPSEHTLVAHGPLRSPEPGTLTTQVGELNWRGNRPIPATRPGFPGEITWVNRDSDTAGQHRGLMTNMFRFAHQQPQPGQTTVPVHSPDRTQEGDIWSKKVGTPELRPPSFNEVETQHYSEPGTDPNAPEDHVLDQKLGEAMAWRPPPGIHPFQQQRMLQPSQFQNQDQGVLFRRRGPGEY